ncbi:MAG: heat-inducible transcriptional repressor HrcA, partial [Acidimicrobiia bacterium]
SDMEQRKAAILQAIVEEYVATAQPVGSQTIARSRDLGVSSATVRNDMNVLEREGYIVQPHTSAGRIPTDHGYRYFVDHLVPSRALPAGQGQVVTDFFASANRTLEGLLLETSQLMAWLTDHAAVVVGPRREQGEVRAVQLVPLQPREILVVAVLSDGSVEKEVARLPQDVGDASLGAAGASLDRWIGARLTELPEPEPTGDADADELVRAARGVLRDRLAPTDEPIFIGGASRIAAEHNSFAATDTAERLLELLERQRELASIVHDLLQGGLTVRIGAENPFDELRDCSLILAPYGGPGDPIGTVGVLGPTRMDYHRAMTAVRSVSERLGDALPG